MPARAWRSPAAVRSCNSLAVRGGLARTFGGLATFLVLTFLCAGIYLLEDAVANPLAAQAAALIFAAFIIALAAILLFYLILPKNGAPTSRTQQPRHGEFPPKNKLLGDIVVAGLGDHRR